MDRLEASLRWWGFSRPNIDQWLSIESLPWLSWVLYLIIFDALDYWIHRFQHRCVAAWWTLHAVHHSQRQMTYWSDRQRPLCSTVSARWFARIRSAVARGCTWAIRGICCDFSVVWQSLRRANTLLRGPAWFQRVLGVAAIPQGAPCHGRWGMKKKGRGNVEFCCAIFPCWDMLFGAANFDARHHPTGHSADQLEGRQYGYGF
jgi:sterol desaturase/sphingolipid hydroxylase (fatty acid hydroxylase superfamily)